MYYQSIRHITRKVSGAKEAAEIIHNKEAQSFDALVWASCGRTLAAVADGGLNDPWMEVAVIRIDFDPPTKIDSITFGWMPDLASKVAALKSCETCEFKMGRTSLPLDGAGDDRITGFTCGCCGGWFTSTICEQERFDQDDGYGICEGCDSRYGDWSGGWGWAKPTRSVSICWGRYRDRRKS